MSNCFPISCSATGLPLHEFFHLLQVFGRIERHTEAFTTVTAGTPGLLIIAFERLGHVIVNHKPHIGLVDAHAKGYGGHNHVDLFKQKRILVGTAGSRIHAGMIGQRLDVVDPEHLGQFLDSLAASDSR